MDVQQFAQFLQMRRKELSMTQTELAEKLHVTDKAISRWERAVGFPDIKLLEPLAEALDLTLIELLQSQKLQQPLTESESQAMAQETEVLLAKQKKLSWQRKLVLWLGNGVIVAMCWILVYVSHQSSLDLWLRNCVYGIALAGAFFGCRGLQYIVERLYLRTGPWKIWYRYQVWVSGILLMLGVLAVRHGRYSEDSVVSAVAMLAGIALMVVGCLITFTLKEPKEE